jgi:hypothetical protein
MCKTWPQITIDFWAIFRHLVVTAYDFKFRLLASPCFRKEQLAPNTRPYTFYYTAKVFWLNMIHAFAMGHRLS